MVQVMHPTFDIQRVREVRPCDGGMQVTFVSGLSGCLRKGHPDYERALHQARNSLQHGSSVGLMVNEAKEFVELSDTYQSTVRHVRDDEDDPGRLMIEFWAYSPICYLTRDHPEFERIKHTLASAAANDQQVLFANHRHMVEGDTETWWKIMDVRAA
jgi:hypothetical protein